MSSWRFARSQQTNLHGWSFERWWSQKLTRPVVAAGVGPPPDPDLFPGHGQFVIPCRRGPIIQLLDHAQDDGLFAHGDCALVLSMPSVLGRGFVRSFRA